MSESGPESSEDDGVSRSRSSSIGGSIEFLETRRRPSVASADSTESEDAQTAANSDMESQEELESQEQEQVDAVQVPWSWRRVIDADQVKYFR